MKKLLTICIAISLFACKEEEPKIDYAHFSGKIENPVDKVVTILDGRKKIKEMPLAEDGTFADTLKVEPGYYTLRHDRESSAIYLKPGDDIKVTLNFKEFDETLIYSGVGAENNNYLAAKYLANEKSNFDYKKVYSMEEAEFSAIMDEVKSSKVEMIKGAKNISDEFRKLENKSTEYEYLSLLQNYAAAHSFYTNKEDFKPSEDFTKRIEGLDYSNEEDYNNFNYYKQLVQSHYSSKIKETDNPSEVFKMINEEAFPALKKDLANMLNYQIAPNNEKNEAYYKGLMAMSSDDKFKEELTVKYNKVKNLAKGMPSPKFIEYENHKGGSTSLEDLKGKYVYVDVWATWCSPCIREIPSLKEVEKQFHGKNIAFVSTSIDKAKDHNTWVEMVKNKELGGMQLMADNDWNSKFVKDYAIEGIPRFILIDPDGNIVSADAPRPSNPKLVELFKELKI